MPPFAVLAAAAAAALVGLPAVHAQEFTRWEGAGRIHIPICTGDKKNPQTLSEMTDTELECSSATTVTACVEKNKKSSNRCFWLSKDGTMTCINLYVMKDRVTEDAIFVDLNPPEMMFSSRTTFCNDRDGPKNPLLCATVGSPPVKSSETVEGTLVTEFFVTKSSELVTESQYCAMINAATRPACSDIAPAPELAATTSYGADAHRDKYLNCGGRSKSNCADKNTEGSNRCFWLENRCEPVFVSGGCASCPVQLFGEKGVLAPADVCGSNPFICVDAVLETRTRRGVTLRFLDEAAYCERATTDWRPACNTKAIAKAMDAYTPASDLSNTCDGASDETNCHRQNTATSVQCHWLTQLQAGNKGAGIKVAGTCLRVYALASSIPARNIVLSVDGRIWKRHIYKEQEFCEKHTPKAAADSLYSWQPIWISWLSVAGLYTVVGGWLLVVRPGCL